VEPLAAAGVVEAAAPMLVALVALVDLACATCGVGKMRKALIDETGTVVNVIEVDGGWVCPDGHTLVASETASTGDTWDGQSFTTPVHTPTPEELAIQAVEAETTAVNDGALAAYQNWDSLTPPERLAWTKMLLGDFVSRNRENYL
jgi:hypothetical protein